MDLFLIVVLHLLFFLLGLYLLVPACRYYIAIAKIKKWDIVAGMINEVCVNGKWVSVSTKSEFTKVNRIQLKYHYIYKGKKYDSSNLTIDGIKDLTKLLNQSKAVFIKDFYFLRERIIKSPYVSVWVNPQNAAESLIMINGRIHLIKLLTGIMLILWGLSTPRYLFKIGMIQIDKKIEVIEAKIYAPVQESGTEETEEQESEEIQEQIPIEEFPDTIQEPDRDWYYHQRETEVFDSINNSLNPSKEQPD